MSWVYWEPKSRIRIFSVMVVQKYEESPFFSIFSHVNTLLMKLSFALLLLLFPFVGCRFGPFHVVKGNGDVQKQERALSNFRSVDVRGFFNVYLTQGDN